MNKNTLPQTVVSGSEKKETPKNTHGSVGSQWNADMWQLLKASSIGTSILSSELN